MVSMKMKTSQLLPPFVIFKGGFGKTLIKSKMIMNAELLSSPKTTGK